MNSITIHSFVGILSLRRDHFELKESEGFRYYAKVKSEKDKNHKETSDPRNSGILLFHEDEETKLNVGLFFQIYLECLHPNQIRLFQRARPVCKKFDLDDFGEHCLFEDSPLGKKKIASMLKTLCQAVGHEAFTNHSLRATVIRMLNKMGFEDRTIAGMSGKFNALF